MLGTFVFFQHGRSFVKLRFGDENTDECFFITRVFVEGNDSIENWKTKNKENQDGVLVLKSLYVCWYFLFALKENRRDEYDLDSRC